MKNKITIASCLIIAGFSVNAQKIKNENVPAVVMQSFQKQYGGVVKSQWEIEEGNYEVSFKKNNEKTEVVFSPEGMVVQTENELSSTNRLPKEIITAMNKDFVGYKFSEAEKIVKADGKILYSVDAEMKELEYELIYDEKGTLISKNQEEKKEKSDSKEKKK